MGSRLERAELMLRVGRVEIPLGDLLDPSGDRDERFADLTAAADGFSAPSLRPPELSGALDVELPPLRVHAVSEVLRHTRSARVHVALPIAPFERSFGPLKIEVGKGHTVNITVEVDEGRIDRESTFGTIDPPLELPLKAELRGVQLARDGSLVADIKNLPDINLSRFALGNLRIPEFLEDLVDMLPEGGIREEATDETDDNATEDAALAAPEDVPVDLADIRIRAVNIRPRPDPFLLFGLGTVTFSEGTVLQLDYAEGHLTCSGRVLVENAAVRGRRFSVAGVSFSGTFVATFDGDRPTEGLALDIQGDDGHLDQLALVLSDGSHFVAKDASCSDMTISYAKDGDEEHIHLKTTHAEGSVRGARVRALIGGQPHYIDIAEMHVAGALDVSDKFYHADLQLDNARAQVENLVLPLGLARFWLSLAEARASGRLVVGTDFGLSFSGELMTHAAVRAGEVIFAGLAARVADGTTADFTFNELAFGEERLDVLRGTGQLDLKLQSGSIPLFTGAAMKFSRGAEGTLSLSTIHLAPEHRFAHLEGNGTLVAHADETPLTPLFELPAGTAHVQAAKVGLMHDGRAFASDVRLWVESDNEDVASED